jgi:hypothetical protein
MFSNIINNLRKFFVTYSIQFFLSCQELRIFYEQIFYAHFARGVPTTEITEFLMVFLVNSVPSVVKSFSLVRFRELPQKNHLLKKQNTNIILPAIETLVLVIFAPAKNALE